MRDWKREIREQLPALELPPDIKEEIIAELASHVEESEEEREFLVHFSGSGWRELARKIYRAKQGEGMNHSKSSWIPVFVNLVLTSTLINVCDRLGMMDLRIYRADPIPLTPQPWLFLLPMCGATAAFLARRGAVSSAARVFAALIPCVVWFTVPLVLELIFLCFPRTFVGIPFRSLAMSSIWLLIVPALALLLGAAPFLRTPNAKPQCE
jgi:hypothetical protein